MKLNEFSLNSMVIAHRCYIVYKRVLKFAMYNMQLIHPSKMVMLNIFIVCLPMGLMPSAGPSTRIDKFPNMGTPKMSPKSSEIGYDQ